MSRIALAALLVATRVAAQEQLPPPPPPPEPESAPARDPRDVPLPPPPAAATAPTDPSVLGTGPIAPAGSQAAPLEPDTSVSRWSFSLASGFIGRFGGMVVQEGEANTKAMLYLGAQADGAWAEGRGRAARLRLRMMTGGEEVIFLPSDGEVEAAYLLGRREFRFVLGRIELARYPSLGVEALAQVGTLPAFEGSLRLAGDTMRLAYYVAPVQAAWIHYYGNAHLQRDEEGWRSESSRPEAATAARVRFTAVVPPAVRLSLQGDFMKFWGQPDLLLAAEASAGYAVLENSVLFTAAIRWDSFRRRGEERDSEVTEDDVKVFAVATLVF
jgi:hypothetical protein